MEQCSIFLEQLSQRVKNGNISSTDESVKIPNLAILEQTLDEIDDDVKTQGENRNASHEDYNHIADIGNKIATEFSKVKQLFSNIDIF